MNFQRLKAGPENNEINVVSLKCFLFPQVRNISGQKQILLPIGPTKQILNFFREIWCQGEYILVCTEAKNTVFLPVLVSTSEKKLKQVYFFLYTWHLKHDERFFLNNGQFHKN